MQRELKFRAWNPDDLRMEYPLVLAIGIDGKLNPLIKCYGGNAYKDYPLMQFTGLRDKNGKDIYEGDILKCDFATSSVKDNFICMFKDYRWKFNSVAYPEDDFYGTVNYDFITCNCEVIGNIYEHLNLLK